MWRSAVAILDEADHGVGPPRLECRFEGSRPVGAEHAAATHVEVLEVDIGECLGRRITLFTFEQGRQVLLYTAGSRVPKSKSTTWWNCTPSFLNV